MRSLLAAGLWTFLGTTVHGQIVLIPVAPPPVFIPVEAAPPAVEQAPATSTSQKPVATRLPVELVEHYYINDAKNIRAYPPANGYGPEVQRIIRIYHLNDQDGKKADAETKKPETPTGAAAPKGSAEKDPKEPVDLLKKLDKGVNVPDSREADKKKQYGPPPPPASDKPETANNGDSSALAPRITAVSGVFVTKTDGNPMGDMEIAFTHVPPQDGMAYSEQKAKTDPKGRFSVRLEPGDWIASFVLPNGEGRRYLSTIKVDPASAATDVKFSF